VFQAKRVDGPDIHILTVLNTECIKAPPQLGGALKIVGDAGNAAWRPYVLEKHPGKLDGQGFCLATTRARKNNTISL
jgi:hypothetical protein